MLKVALFVFTFGAALLWSFLQGVVRVQAQSQRQVWPWLLAWLVPCSCSTFRDGSSACYLSSVSYLSGRFLVIF